MILSDLNRLPVEVEGEKIGYVVDARFGVPSSGTKVEGPARLIGLIVDRRKSASFLGYERKSVNGPEPIARYLAWHHRAAFLLKWEDIQSIGHEAIEARPGFTRHDLSLD